MNKNKLYKNAVLAINTISAKCKYISNYQEDTISENSSESQQLAAMSSRRGGRGSMTDMSMRPLGSYFYSQRNIYF